MPGARDRQRIHGQVHTNQPLLPMPIPQSGTACASVAARDALRQRVVHGDRLQVGLHLEGTACSVAEAVDASLSAASCTSSPTMSARSCGSSSRRAVSGGVLAHLSVAMRLVQQRVAALLQVA